MKNFVKIGIAALAGYFVGFYELKYKTMKMMLEHELNKKEGEEP